MPPREIHASVGQRLLWLKLEHERWSAVFNCPIVCRLDGPLDRASLRDALDALYGRHDALRTTVVRRRRELRQIIHPATPIVERFHDLSHAPDPQEAVAAHLRDEIATAIDPAQCASRITLWRLADERHLLCLNLHHLITDTWSCMVLQRELPLLYEQRRRGDAPALPAVGWQFGQFMAYQQRQMAGDGFQRHREYWETQLAGASAPRLPLGAVPGRGVRSRATVRGDIDAADARVLRDLATRHRVTPFTILLSIYDVLLRALTGASDIAVATLFANRLRPEVERTIGFIANLVILRTRLDDVATFTDVVARVQSTVGGGIAHQAFPYHVAMQRRPVAANQPVGQPVVNQPAAAQRAPGAGRLDRVVFQMLGERIDQTWRAGDVSFNWLVPDVGGRFDLELSVMPIDEVLGVKLYYSTEAVDPAWADQFLKAYLAVAAAVAAAPDGALDDVTAALTAQPFI